MTIEYLDSKRITMLSTSSESLLTSSDYTSSNFTTVGSTVAITNNSVVFTNTPTNADNGQYKQITALAESDSYTLNFKLNVSAHATFDNYLLYISNTSGNPDASNSLKIQTQGGSYNRFTFGTRISGTNSEAQSSNNTASTGTDYYCTVTSDGSTATFKAWTNSGRTGTASVTLTKSITGLGTLNYIQHRTRNSGDSNTWSGTVSEVALSKTLDKPTNVQNNSILVEKDTAKRYWFSKATVVDDDLTTDKGWVSNTSDWTYNATGDYIDFATVRRSTTAQQIYLDVQDSDYLGSGNNLSDTAWTARFKIRTGAISSSGNVLLYLGFSNNLGDSGTTQQSACMCTNVNGNANENNMSLQVSRENFETTSTPARVRSDVLSNTNLPYNTDLYMEMIRDGDTFTLKAYTNEYVTQTGATATATVTGISSLRYIKAFTDSEQNGNTSTGARLYDMKITNGSDTWTFPPTLEDNFPSMSGWVEVVTGGNFQVTGNKLVGETQSGNGGTNGGGIYKDYGLGTFDNSKFVLRCKYQILTQSGGSGNACSLYFGISSTKGDGSASSPNANRDGFAITVTNYASSGMLWNYPNDTTWDNSDTDLSLTPTVADYYLEIARTSPTSVTFTLYSDEYNTVVRTHTQAITADLKDLRYLMFQEWRNSSSNTTKVAVSELKLYNKVSSV